jgi:hypothetical protein
MSARIDPRPPSICAWCFPGVPGPPGTSHTICRHHCITLFGFDPEAEEPKEAA